MYALLAATRGIASLEAGTAKCIDSCLGMHWDMYETRPGREYVVGVVVGCLPALHACNPPHSGAADESSLYLDITEANDERSLKGLQAALSR